jgi:hypothetical protein
MKRFISVISLFLAAPAFAQTGSITGTPISGSTGSFTTLSATGPVNTAAAAGYQLGGTSVLGNGISGSIGPSVGPAVVLSSTTDYSTATADTRQNQFAVTLSPSVTTNNIWENLNSYVTLNGPGVANGEINVFHSSMALNAGATFSAGGGENYEADLNNSGTISGAGWNANIAFAYNQVGATLSSYAGYSTFLNNWNTAAGSVGIYTGFACNGATSVSGGALPTVDYCLRNGDAKGLIATVGNVSIGTVGALTGQLGIVAPNSTGSTMMQLVNSNNNLILRASSNGNFTLGTPGVIPGFIFMAGATSGLGVLEPPAVASNFQWVLPAQGGTLALDLTSTTASIGGSALAAGACASFAQSVPNSATSMAAVASPVTYPGDGFEWGAYVSAAGTVTVKVCALIAGTPAASTYNVRVIQ